MTRLFDIALLIKIFQIFDTLYSYGCEFALFDTIPCDTQLHPPDSSALLWWIFQFKAPLQCSIQKLYCQHLVYASQYNEVAPVNFRSSKRLSYLIPPLLLKKVFFPTTALIWSTALIRYPRVTRVWIHIWWWNDAQSLILLRRGALWIFKVIRQISRSRRILTQIGHFHLLYLQFEFTNGYKMMHKAWSSIEEVPCCF